MNKLLFRTVFFCLSVLSLSSCRQDDETERSNESGDLVAVNIPIEGVRVESADSPLTRVGSADTLTVTEDLEDGFVLETSLIPVSAGATRASITTGLASDVQILAIAYKESGELYKYQYFTPGSPVIHLPKGERFKLVFYSYNSTAKPDISRDITGSVSPGKNGFLFSKNASLNDKSEIHTNNVMWGRIDRTPVITGGITLSGVTFTHLFSRLDWQLRSVVGTITECSGSVRNTYENGTIKLGNLVNVSGGSNGNDTWIGTGSANYAAPVRFAAVGSTDITSLKTIFCPNAGQDINLALSKITVGGKTFTGQRHTFPTKLKRGVNYRAESIIKRRMTVTFRAASGGAVTPEGAQTATAYGEKITCTAKPLSGKSVEWYKDGVKLAANTLSEVMDGDRITVTVNEMTEGKVYEAKFTDGPWASGNLIYKDGKYSFSGGVNTPDEYCWLAGSLNPNKIVPVSEFRDPCKQIKAEGGGWRMPTISDWEKIYISFFLSSVHPQSYDYTYQGKIWKITQGEYYGYDLQTMTTDHRSAWSSRCYWAIDSQGRWTMVHLNAPTNSSGPAVASIQSGPGFPSNILTWTDQKYLTYGWVYRDWVGKAAIRCIK